jgi:hypothetical protein
VKATEPSTCPRPRRRPPLASLEHWPHGPRTRNAIAHGPRAAAARKPLSPARRRFSPLGAVRPSIALSPFALSPPLRPRRSNVSSPVKSAWPNRPPRRSHSRRRPVQRRLSRTRQRPPQAPRTRLGRRDARHPHRPGFPRIRPVPGAAVRVDPEKSPRRPVLRLARRRPPPRPPHRVADLRAVLDTELARLGRDTPVAIFPEGPRPIPSVASPA